MGGARHSFVQIENIKLLGEGGANGVMDDALLGGIVMEESMSLGLLAMEEDAIDGNFKVSSGTGIHIFDDLHAGGKFLDD